MSNKERKFSESSTLISVTDVKGVIQYCNSDFIDISGFTEAELINSHHNIVRHPDMPKAAFEDLWETIQKDKPWQGMVKNRCKNGDYYWVHAYVTPIFDKGVKTGYQSVRSCPTPQQINDAELLYDSLNINPTKKIPKPPFLKRMKLAVKINIILLLLSFLFLYEQITAEQFFTIAPEYLVFNLGFVSLVGLLTYLINIEFVNRVKALTKTLRTISSGDLNEKIDVEKFDEIGSTTMSCKMLQGRLKAIIGRFTESTQNLSLAIDVLSESGYQTKINMDKQHVETEMVATAMNEMSATVTEIAQNTTKTSDYSATANDMATTGKETVESTRETVLELATDVKAAADTINELAIECTRIKDITSAISDIADQTNLLALNAAIEAARAGEYGRGFSVVADEVRSLSSRTQASTLEINTMIETLQNKSQDSVLAMEHGLEKVNYSVEKIQSTEGAFNQIVESVTDVNDMNMQIATAAEEQSCVTEEMNNNVHSINNQSQETIKNVLTLEEKISSLKNLLTSLELQLEQYDLGEPASQFDFNAAKNAHLAWKSKVRDFLRGDVNAITKEQICSHRECMLGKWYYSQGKKSYGHSKHFQQIEAPHARLHEIVKEVYGLHEVGELDQANSLYKELGPLSDNIVSLLDKTKLSVS